MCADFRVNSLRCPRWRSSLRPSTWMMCGASGPPLPACSTRQARWSPSQWCLWISTCARLTLTPFRHPQSNPGIMSLNERSQKVNNHQPMVHVDFHLCQAVTHAFPSSAIQPRYHEPEREIAEGEQPPPSRSDGQAADLPWSHALAFPAWR